MSDEERARPRAPRHERRGHRTHAYALPVPTGRCYSATIGGTPSDSAQPFCVAMIPDAVQQRPLTKQNPRAQLLRGGTASVALQVTNTFLALLTGVVLARILGPAGYGTYAFVVSLATLLAVPAQIGLPQLVVRETARAHTQKHWGLMRGLWRWATGVSLASSLLLTFATGATAWLFARHLPTLQLVTLAWGVLLVPLTTLGNLRGAALRGLGNVVQGQFPELVLRRALLILFVGLASRGARDLTAHGAMALHVLAATVAFLVGAWLLHQSRPSPLRSDPTIPVYESRKWITSAMPLAFVAGVWVIKSQTDILMLGMFEGAENVGIYRVAVQGAALVMLGLNAINMVASPQFARLYAEGDMVSLQKVATASGRVSLLLALPVVLVFLLFGRPILAHLFGPEYVSGYGAFAILTLGQLANAAFGCVAFVLTMTGHEQITARTVGFAAICNLALNLVFIPTLGLNGAALATGSTTLLMNLLLWRSLRRELGLESTGLPIKHESNIHEHLRRNQIV